MVYFREFTFIIKIDHLVYKELSCLCFKALAWSGQKTVLVVLPRSSAGTEIFGGTSNGYEEDIIHLNDTEENDEVKEHFVIIF